MKGPFATKISMSAMTWRSSMRIIERPDPDPMPPDPNPFPSPQPPLPDPSPSPPLPRPPIPQLLEFGPPENLHVGVPASTMGGCSRSVHE